MLFNDIPGNFPSIFPTPLVDDLKQNKIKEACQFVVNDEKVMNVFLDWFKELPKDTLNKEPKEIEQSITYLRTNPPLVDMKAAVLMAVLYGQLCNEDGNSPLHRAILDGDKNSFKKILDLPVTLVKEMCQENLDGNTPMHLLAIKGDEEGIRSLMAILSNKEEWFTYNKKDMNPFSSLITSGHTNIVLNLLKTNDMPSKDDFGNSVLYLAIFYDQPKLVDELFQFSKETLYGWCESNDSKTSPLHWAMLNCEYLSKLFYYINDKTKIKEMCEVDDEYFSPLHYASTFSGDVNALTLLRVRFPDLIPAMCGKDFKSLSPLENALVNNKNQHIDEFFSYPLHLVLKMLLPPSMQNINETLSSDDICESLGKIPEQVVKRVLNRSSLYPLITNFKNRIDSVSPVELALIIKNSKKNDLIEMFIDQIEFLSYEYKQAVIPILSPNDFRKLYEKKSHTCNVLTFANSIQLIEIGNFFLPSMILDLPQLPPSKKQKLNEINDKD